MPRQGTQLSQEDEAIVNALVERKFRLITVGDEHAEVVRRQGQEVFRRAFHEAARDLEPQPGGEGIIPPRGTNMEEYYRNFETILTANAQTPYEHMYIALVAANLIAVVNACEYAYLPERLQRESDLRMAQREFTLSNKNAATGPQAQISTQRLQVLPPLGQGVPREPLTHRQVNEYLENFSKLHHKILWDASSQECYKIIGANYSQDNPTIDSYEVQLQGCSSAVTYSFDSVKQMLLQSSSIRTSP